MVAGLALLAVPRPILHDLGIVEEGSAVNLALVFLPLLVWVAVAVRRPRPFPFLLLAGLLYGVLLALTHQVLWSANGADEVRLGGELAGRLSPALEQVVLRAFAAVGSVFTGLLVGAVTGLAAWGLSRLRRSRG